MKKTIVRIEISVLIAVVICCLININVFSEQCDSIRDKMLRMHVIANSDSEEDQALKLKVRDAVLSEGKELFDGTISSQDAEKILIPHIKDLEQIASETIKNEGFDYDVKITVQEEFFNTRVYDNAITLPAGNYMAVKVIIGEGKGQNWWCVMFPPMCLPATNAESELSDVLTDEETEIVTDSEKYEFRFKIIELLEDFMNRK